ncbi:MAG: KTSC domain-containing protein [Candidatus Pacebacteria bacterium]|nr:KTSC domain-containing protein [Candidatus Paceibacterota bacterium]
MSIDNKKIFENIDQVDTPDSSSIAGYGYDTSKKILYVKYRNNSKVYSFENLSLEAFKSFKNSKSKGKEVARLRKELAGM